jgi:hypothetical protein
MRYEPRFVLHSNVRKAVLVRVAGFIGALLLNTYNSQREMIFSLTISDIAVDWCGVRDVTEQLAEELREFADAKVQADKFAREDPHVLPLGRPRNGYRRERIFGRIERRFVCRLPGQRLHISAGLV